MTTGVYAFEIQKEQLAAHLIALFRSAEQGAGPREARLQALEQVGFLIRDLAPSVGVVPKVRCMKQNDSVTLKIRSVLLL